MSTSYSWPSDLPQKPLDGAYGEQNGASILSSPMDAGEPKRRRRGEKADQLTMTFMMTTAQVTSFETFVKTTILATRRFNFTHPRKGNSIEARLVPAGDGVLYSLASRGSGYWHVSVQMEVMP